MRKQRPTVEWIVAESEADWDRLCAPSMSDMLPHANNRIGRNRSLWVVGTLLLLLASVSSWWSHTNQIALQPTVDERVTLQSVPGAIEADHRSLVDTVIGYQMTKDWRRQFNQEESNGHAGQATPPAASSGIEISKIETLGDRAVVSIITTAKRGDPSFRQTRFYQHTAAEWLRTEPDAAQWGPARTLETPYFVYHFREHDAPAVITVAPQIDALYTMLTRNFGVPLVPDTEKLMIEVRITQSPDAPLRWLGKSAPITAASPALYLAPVEISDAELLAQSLAIQLIEGVSAQAAIRYRIGDEWQPLLNGMHLWQLWDLQLPLANWRKDVVQWVYSDLSTADRRQPPSLPNHYDDLCAAHQLWLMAPLQLGIPLLCSQQQLESVYFSSWYYLDPPIYLAQLKLPTAQYDSSEEIRDRGRTIALATLIEYAVATYGPDRLPVLVAGLGQYDSWATLIPAVYGVSPAAFEAGWQAYLVAHYDISLETIMRE